MAELSIGELVDGQRVVRPPLVDALLDLGAVAARGPVEKLGVLRDLVPAVVREDQLVLVLRVLKVVVEAVALEHTHEEVEIGLAKLNDELVRPEVVRLEKALVEHAVPLVLLRVGDLLDDLERCTFVDAAPRAVAEQVQPRA